MTKKRFIAEMRKIFNENGLAKCSGCLRSIKTFYHNKNERFSSYEEVLEDVKRTFKMEG